MAVYHLHTGLTRALVNEMKPFFIRANVVLPGYIKTEMTEGKSLTQASFPSGAVDVRNHPRRYHYKSHHVPHSQINRTPIDAMPDLMIITSKQQKYAVANVQSQTSTNSLSPGESPLVAWGILKKSQMRSRFS